jgi:hypothetical protein
LTKAVGVRFVRNGKDKSNNLLLALIALFAMNVLICAAKFLKMPRKMRRKATMPNLSDFTTDELIAEINEREEMHKVLDSVGVDSLIEAIDEKTGLQEYSVRQGYKYAVCTEHGDVITDTDKARILIIED